MARRMRRETSILSKVSSVDELGMYLKSTYIFVTDTAPVV